MSEIIGPQDIALVQAFRRDLWALPERDDTDQMAKRRLRRRHGADPMEFFATEAKKSAPETPASTPAGYYETDEDTYYYSYGDAVMPGSFSDRRFWIGTALAAGTLAAFLIAIPAVISLAEANPQRYDHTFSDNNLAPNHDVEPQTGPAQYSPPDPSALHPIPTSLFTK